MITSYASRRTTGLREVSMSLTSGKENVIIIEAHYMQDFRDPTWNEVNKFRQTIEKANIFADQVYFRNVLFSFTLVHAFEVVEARNGILLDGIRWNPNDMTKIISYFEKQKKIFLIGLYSLSGSRFFHNFEGELSICKTTLTLHSIFCLTPIVFSKITKLSVKNVKISSRHEKKLFKATSKISSLREIEYPWKHKPVTKFPRMESFSFSLIFDTLEKRTASLPLYPLFTWTVPPECTLSLTNVKANSPQWLRQLFSLVDSSSQEISILFGEDQSTKLQKSDLFQFYEVVRTELAIY